MHSTLIVIEGPLKGTLLPLHEGEVSIGRDDSNTLAIDDLAASRCHCKIRRERDRFRLADAGSRNGTFVNGKVVREHVLAHGDQIRIGSSVFLFSQQSAPALEPPETLDDDLL